MAPELDLEVLYRSSLYPVKRLALNRILFYEVILWSKLQGRKSLMNLRDLETLIIVLVPFEVEAKWPTLPMEEYKKELGTSIKLISTIDPNMAAEDPSNPERFRTNRFIESLIERRLDCSTEERPWKLQGMLDAARETIRDMWVENRGWKVPKVEVCVAMKELEG
jgi:hypothetical protein